MSNRTYNFELPYEISSFYVTFGINKLKSEGTFDKLPAVLQAKLQHASENWEAVLVTKTELDSIDDDVWKILAAELGLDWS